ncbi:MAG: IS66 family insertion sequence element accessory protein TnpB [Alphaproteobacteria bacterium]|nr:IS66 family insertion sequence element accessory protein TnpB [Alphaproteobacteria bacterium]
MLISAPPRILVARDHVDFRKSIDGLAAVCEVVLEEQPLDGTLFLFTNRRRDALKGLVWTHGGFVLFYKRLERGRFRWPDLDRDRGTMTAAELAALMEGIDLTAARRLSRWNPGNFGDNGTVRR